VVLTPELAGCLSTAMTEREIHTVLAAAERTFKHV